MSASQGRDPVARAVALHERAVALSELGDSRRALAPCRRALKLLEAHEGPGSADVANVSLDLGRILESLARYDEALDAVERARALLAAMRVPRGDAEGARLLRLLRFRAEGEIGAIQVLRADYRAARRAHLRALRIAEQHLGDEELAQALNGLGIVGKYTARWDEAEQLYRRALALTERIHGRGHVATAFILHNLAGLEHTRGRFARAEPWARRAVATREAALGPDHPDTAADVAELAAVLAARGKLDEAEPLYRRAIASFRRAFGASHFEVAFNVGQLAALHHARGRAAHAARLYAKAIGMLRVALGDVHPVVAQNLANLAALRHAQGRDREAASLLEEAVSVLRGALGARHPQVRAMNDDLCEVRGSLAQRPRRRRTTKA